MVFVKIGYYILVMPTLPCGIGQVAEKVRAAFQKSLPRFDLFHISFLPQNKAWHAPNCSTSQCKLHGVNVEVELC